MDDDALREFRTLLRAASGRVRSIGMSVFSTGSYRTMHIVCKDEHGHEIGRMRGRPLTFGEVERVLREVRVLATRNPERGGQDDFEYIVRSS